MRDRRPLAVMAAMLALAGCARQANVGLVGGGIATAPPVAPRAESPAVEFLPAMAPVWQLRAALNAAALSCRLAGDRIVAASYNRLLNHHREALAAAYAAEQDRYRRAHGARWQSVQDTEMTRLYNRYGNFGQSPRFCATAAAVSDAALATAAGELPRFATTALPQLIGAARNVASR